MMLGRSISDVDLIVAFCWLRETKKFWYGSQARLQQCFWFANNTFDKMCDQRLRENRPVVVLEYKCKESCEFRVRLTENDVFRVVLEYKKLIKELR
jgi:hypothetical protein